MGIRIKDRERFGAKSKQKLLDFKPLEENTVNLQCINSIAPIKACESVLEVKSKKSNIIIISLDKTEYLKVHFTSKYGYFSKMFKISFYIKS